MKPKMRAVVMLLAVSFLIPLGEVLVLGHPEPFGKFGLIYSVLAACAIYWWYHLDKRERGFRAGAIQNIGVAVFSIIGLPVYFFRSRGLGRGALATLIALAIFIVASVLIAAGEVVGRHIAF
jgi:hypothetical protein